MKEHISALVDNELDSEMRDQTLNTLTSNPHLQDTWAVYHTIGEAMRDQSGLAPGLSRKIMQKLEQEPTVLAPTHPPKKKRRYPLALAASFVAIAILSGTVLWQQKNREEVPASPPVLATAQPQIADNNLEDINPYWTAHHNVFIASGTRADYLLTANTWVNDN